MIRVGYGATLLARGLRGNGIDGIGTYTRELGHALEAGNHADIVPVTFGQRLPPGNLHGAPVRLPPYGLSALLSTAVHTPFMGSRRLHPYIDVFHATDHLVPRLKHTPVLATVMDTIPLEHPEWLRSPRGRLKAQLWRRMTRQAQHIVTISEHAREKILLHFDLPSERVSAIPLGVQSGFFERLNAAEKQAVRDQYGLPETFLLFIGTLQPRKNVDRLIAAHERLPKDIRRTMPLVVVGRAGWACNQTITRLERRAERGEAFWLSQVPDHALRALMQSATALAFPSLAEGFGLPVIEAFASGLPVITSNTSSLPEVAGDAALLVDPTDIDTIRDAMARLVDDPTLRHELAIRGHERARHYTWEATARSTAELYHSVAQ